MLCEAALALGLTLGGICKPGAPPEAVDLPAEDKEVWTFAPPPPPEPVAEPPPPAPAPTPNFPPIVIREQAAPVAPLPVALPEPVFVEPPAPNPFRLALAAALPARATEDTGLVRIAASTVSDLDGIDPLSARPLAAIAPPPVPIPEEHYQAEGRISTGPVDNARIVTADRYISGIVETGINSQVSSEEGGQVIIQTSRPVFGYHDRHILIPKGSRLICDYKSPENLGETRIALTCKRILIAGHRAEILQLKATVGDVQGRGGITGEVDTRFWEKYGTAFVLAGISGAVRLASAATAVADDGNAISSIADTGAQELSEKLGEITASILEQTVNLKPIVTVAQGTRVQIRPQFDWYLKQVKGGE
ncbi:TrbI/VirB10 family protein [Rhodospirillaceae bacterium KN72]|uniref:TrbI/VirB10 family protein n=1 Tax=Pacificispira spongiicola TaxID=2729598 RepID=A0A7Y0DYG0_9PROT|nr:TrbI/VirB10 family protein [Pacificispira spongiicola]NMM43922.1 TrbI/VirB10 family protein [Pacificispira spongiicola]